MKKFMYKAVVESPYKVRTMYLCSDKKKLTEFLDNNYADTEFIVREISKSGKFYCTDGNTGILQRPLD